MTLGQISLAIIAFFISLVGSSIYFLRQPAPTVARQTAAIVLALPDLTPRYLAGITLPVIDMGSIQAESFIIGTESGVVLAEKNSAVRTPIASLTKIMTGLVLADYGGNAVVQLNPEHKSTPPKISNLPAGETFSAGTAQILLLVESDNDVAEAITAAVGPRIDQNRTPRDAFVAAMNQAAVQIGMTSSHFKNPTGLDEPGHFSTAQNLFQLVQFVDRAYPHFWNETADPPKYIETLSGHRYAIESSSLLVSYPGIIGMKTGLTDAAGGALALRYRIADFPEDIIIILLRSPDRFRDGEGLINAVRRAFHQT